MPKLIGLLLFLTLLAPSTSAVAQASGGPVNLVKVDLIADQSTVRPGTSVWVALVQRITPGWHTYWTNPGDSGLPTSVTWTLPSGVIADDIQWPAPHRIPTGPLVNYGYDDEVVLPIRMQVPADAPVGTTLALKGEVEWLVCKDVCIPENAAVSLDLTVGAISTAGAGASAILAARDALPRESPWPVAILRDGADFVVRVMAPGLDGGRLEEVTFFPSAPAAIAHAAPQRLTITPDHLTLRVPAGDVPPAVGARLDGVLVLGERLEGKAVRQAFAVTAPPIAAAGPTMVQPVPMAADAIGLWGALLLAFAGGLILNLMPCVLPVLAMKAMGFAGHAHGARATLRGQGIAYSVGVLISFATIGGLLLILRAAGDSVGWGFQLQSPVVVAALACLTFAIGLSFSGVLTLGRSLMGVGSGLAARDGLIGSFFTGVVAVLVATPCTAPFMGAALGYALIRPPVEAMAVFLALGAGMAVPFLALSFTPRALSWMPRPGVWMDRLKQFLAFPMYATAIWLVWVFALQAGADGVAALLAAMTLLAFGAWAHDAAQYASRRWQVTAGLAAIAALVGAGIAIDRAATTVPLSAVPGAVAAPPSTGPTALKVGAVTWEPFTPGRLTAAQAEGRPILLNVTAAWCITCLVNEKAAMSSDRVAEALALAGVVPIKADWTRRDPAITETLAQFGRSGVPLYVLYPPGRSGRTPEILPQILTEGEVLAAISRLAPST